MRCEHCNSIMIERPPIPERDDAEKGQSYRARVQEVRPHRNATAGQIVLEKIGGLEYIARSLEAWWAVEEGCAVMLPAKTGSIGIVLIDDHPSFREGLQSLFDLYADIEVVGESSIDMHWFTAVFERSGYLINGC